MKTFDLSKKAKDKPQQRHPLLNSPNWILLLRQHGKYTDEPNLSRETL